MDRNCPMCKAVNSLRQESGSLVCQTKNCFYVDLHPISYDNDVRQYQGEDKKQNRFSQYWNPNMEYGGVEMQGVSNFDNTLKRGKKYISDICHLLKSPKIINDIAFMRLLAILKDLKKQKKEVNAQDQQQDQGRRREKRKNIMCLRNLAGFAIYCACFEKQNWYQDYKLCRLLDLQLDDWKDLNRQMQTHCSEQIQFIPKLTPKYIIVRVCQRHKIDKQEVDAMIEMANRVVNTGKFDVRHSTIAAIAFWKVCQHSKTYHTWIKMQELCKNHEKMYKEKVKISEIVKYFDVTYQNVRKVFKSAISKELYSAYLPSWENRLQQAQYDQ